MNHPKWWKYCWKNRWYFWWLLEIVKFLSQLLSPFLVTILSPNMVTIFSPEMVAFQVNHRKRWKKWWKKRWCLRWMLEISQILSPFLVTILPQNTSFMWSWTEMTSECLKIQRLQSRNSQFCKSRQNVLPTFSHYDVSPASHWSCFSRFYLGWSNLKNIFFNPSSLTKTCSTRELLKNSRSPCIVVKDPFEILTLPAIKGVRSIS